MPFCSLAPVFTDFFLENMNMFFPKSLEFLGWHSKKEKKKAFCFGLVLALMMEGSMRPSTSVHCQCLYFIRTVLGEVLVTGAE